MRLGLTSAILSGNSFSELIDFVSEIGLSSVEVACWPKGKAERRYAGVTHIDVESLGQSKEVAVYAAKKGIAIGALVYSPNFLAPDLAARNEYIAHFKKVIEGAQKLDVPTVQTFIGKDHTQSIGENMRLFQMVWPDLIKFSEDHNVTVAFENCPMYFTQDEWPGGKNLAASPKIWREMFSLIDSVHFGMTYDPSHLAWQRMDYIKPIYEFKDKIVDVHAKDTKFYQDLYDDVGILAHPLEYHAPKLPGLGDIDWGSVMSALYDIRFDGNLFIEIEDRAFEDSEQSLKEAIVTTRNFLRQYLPLR